MTPLLAQFITIIGLYASRISWPGFLTGLFKPLSVFLMVIPGAPFECAFDERTATIIYTCDLLGLPILMSQIFLNYKIVEKLSIYYKTSSLSDFLASKEASTRRMRCMTIGFFAMLWNLQTFMVAVGTAGRAHGLSVN